MSRAAIGCSECDCQDERPSWRVTLTAPDGTVFTEDSPQYEIKGFKQYAGEDCGLDPEYDEPAPQLASFNAAADRTLGQAQDIHRQRGNAYRDSWAIHNQKTTFIDATLDLIGINPDGLSPEAKRLLMVAALVDVKDSRMAGDFHLDNVLDGINYRAAWGAWAEDYHSEW